MPFSRAFANHQEISNLPACFALRNQRSDFAFTGRQPAKSLPGSDTRGQWLLWRESAKRHVFEVIPQRRLINGGCQFPNEMSSCRVCLAGLLCASEALVGVPKRAMDGPQHRLGMPCQSALPRLL